MHSKPKFGPRIGFFGKSGMGKTTLAVTLTKLMLQAYPKSSIYLIARNMDSPINKPLYDEFSGRIRYRTRSLSEAATAPIMKDLQDYNRPPEETMIIFLDDAGTMAGARRKLNSPVMTMAVDAPHKNAILVACFQRAPMALPDLRGNFERVYLFNMDAPDIKWAKSTILANVPEEAQDKIIREGLQSKHDFLEIDLSTFPQPTIFRNGDPTQRLHPSAETGMYAEQELAEL